MARINSQLVTYLMSPFGNVEGGTPPSDGRAALCTRFWEHVEENLSAIHGSVIAWMLRQAALPDWLPNNLNVAIPCGALMAWDAYLVSLAPSGRVQSRELPDIDPTVASNVLSRWEYVVNPVCSFDGLYNAPLIYLPFS